MTASQASLDLLAVDLGPGVRGVFTTRAGGAGDSRGPAGANLKLPVGAAVAANTPCSARTAGTAGTVNSAAVMVAVDVAAATLANRALLARTLGLTVDRLVFAEQPHGARAAVVGGPEPTGVAGVDALVTSTRRLGLAVFAADCMPVLLADPEVGVVAAAHSGRPGLVAGVLTTTVAAMVGQGAQARRIVAVVGPCIGGCCYELPTALADAVGHVVPAARSTTTWGTASIDLRAGADAVLFAAGITDVRHVGGCTYEQPGTFYSYRGGDATDRHGGVVFLT